MTMWLLCRPGTFCCPNFVEWPYLVARYTLFLFILLLYDTADAKVRSTSIHYKLKRTVASGWETDVGCLACKLPQKKPIALPLSRYRDWSGDVVRPLFPYHTLGHWRCHGTNHPKGDQGTVTFHMQTCILLSYSWGKHYMIYLANRSAAMQYARKNENDVRSKDHMLHM